MIVDWETPNVRQKALDLTLAENPGTYYQQMAHLRISQYYVPGFRDKNQPGKKG
jgi:hypothetical protein